MHSGSASIPANPCHTGLAVLVVSADPLLRTALQQIFHTLDWRVQTVMEGESELDAMRSLEDSGIILLDSHLAAVASGRLLEAMLPIGLHRRCAIALIADEVSDEWITRLREGAIDDIVPRNADAAVWNTRLSAMRRGHELYCEVEHLREAALTEIRHDRVTGALQREAILTSLFRETDRVQRLHGALTLVLFDVDDFGHWTRTLGRDACDGILHEVAQRTRRILRSYDLFGRTGNDEFLLALPGCSIVNAAMMAERLRVELFGDPFQVENERGETRHVRLTSCFAVTSSRGQSPLVVLREAEQILTLAKRSGPDSIRCAGGLLRENSLESLG